MDSQLQQLIDRYLSGSASAEEVRQLDGLLREDPATRRALTMSAAMDWQLRHLLAGAAPVAPSSPAPARARWSLPKWLAAAVLLVAVCGWSTAAYFAGIYRAKCRECAAALEKVTELSMATAAKPATSEPAEPRDTPAEVRLIDTRGLVGMLPEGEKQFERVFAGAPVPAGRSLWTCPWGAAGMRCPDGVSLQLDRNTVVVFSEKDGVRHAALKSGIFYITNRACDGGRFVITTAHAATNVTDAQVAVAADADRTIVEVAVGKVDVTRRSDGRTISVPNKHYAIVTDTDEPRIIAGPFAWRQGAGAPVDQ